MLDPAVIAMTIGLVLAVAVFGLLVSRDRPSEIPSQGRREFLKGLFVAGAAVKLLDAGALAEERPVQPDAIWTKGDLFLADVPEWVFFNGALMRPGSDMDYQVVPISQATYRIDFEWKIKEGDMVGLVFFIEGRTQPVTVWVEATQNIYPSS